jgi:hypothetical protein
LKQLGKRLLVSTIIGMILLIDLMAASPELHELIHFDAGQPDHHCTVTLFAHGQVDSAVCAYDLDPVDRCTPVCYALGRRPVRRPSSSRPRSSCFPGIIQASRSPRAD